MRSKKLREALVFSMFAALMFCSKLIMEFLPNVHLLGMFTMLLTVIYRRRALIPIYVYVFLNGLYAGFNLWWFPYLYIWTLLWGITMLLPRSMPDRAAAIVYPIVCCLHGLLYGILYAPAQSLMFGLDFEQTLVWIGAGFYFDLIHGISNFAMGLLVLPLSKVIRKLETGVAAS